MARRKARPVRAKRQTARQREEEQKEEEKSLQKRNDVFAFWMICGSRACLRAKSCTGAPRECFMRLWPLVPEQNKMQFRAFLTAVRGGQTVREALRTADAEVKRWRELMAKLDAGGPPVTTAGMPEGK